MTQHKELIKEVIEGKRRFVLTTSHSGGLAAYPEGDLLLNEYTGIKTIRILSEQETREILNCKQDIKKSNEEYQKLLKKLVLISLLKCVLCNKEFTGQGHNPRPLKTTGSCCDDCNFKKVLPARFK